MSGMVAFASNFEPLTKTSLRARGQDRSCADYSSPLINPPAQADLGAPAAGSRVRLGTCSKDPIGYGGGLNNFLYVLGSPTNFTDPSGCCCICETEPEKCYLEYEHFQHDFGANYSKIPETGELAYVQYSQLGFFVFVKHTEGKSTCDCHIVQSVFRMERKLDPNQAKPNTPASFEPMPTGPLYSWTAGNWIFDFLPRDYNGSETECMGKKLAAIVDQPTIKHTSAFAVADIRASSFQWSSTTYVKEAPSVSGGVGWTTSWNWDDGAQKVKTNFLARSHDGKIDIREVR